MWLLQSDDSTNYDHRKILFRNQEEMMRYIAGNSLQKFSIEWVHVFYPPELAQEQESVERKIYQELVPLSRSEV